VSEESQQTYSAREIVLELFPATHKRLIPDSNDYRLEPDPNGNLIVYDQGDAALLSLSPVTISGRASTQLCCDFCQHSAARNYLQLFRAEVPGSNGRRYCYVSLCRDTEGCNTRRLNDEPLRALLARVLS